MPMTNGESRELAIKEAYALSVNALSQTGPNCTAYVGIWLRKRSRNKQFLMADYFRLTEQDDKVSRFDDMNEDGKPGRAALKADKLQPLMKGGSGHVEHTYIMGGSKNKTKALDLVDDVGATAVSRKAWDGMCVHDFIVELGSKKRLASVGIRTNVPHALGFDCSQKPCVYFDPNLGEFTFPNAKWLAWWWTTCYRKDRGPQPKTNMKSAWSVMVDSVFTAEIYERVK